MNLGARKRTLLLDKLAKQNGWRTLALVGVHDDGEVRGLVAWCKQLKVTAVWAPKFDVTPQERQRECSCRDRMVRWTGVYDRLRLVQSPTADAPALLAGEQFDAVALWNHRASQLAAEGPLWAAMVRDGGMLLGLDHRDINTRRVLNNAVPKWRMLRDGVWLVDVKRQAQPIQGADDDVELIEYGVAVEADVTHDPVDSRLGADDAVHVAAPVVEAEGSEPVGENVAHIPPRRRGRPPGSRNKAASVAAA